MPATPDGRAGNADAAKHANEIASGLFEEPMFHRTRDNWVDVVLLIELGELINRAAMRGEKFNALVQGGIDVMLEHVGKFRRKAGQ